MKRFEISGITVESDGILYRHSGCEYFQAIVKSKCDREQLRYLRGEQLLGRQIIGVESFDVSNQKNKAVALYTAWERTNRSFCQMHS